MMQPHVVDKIINHDSGELITKMEPRQVGTPISAETAKKVRDILETVVTSENGTGKRFGIEGYKVAGKTGTAQIPDPKGGYLTGPSNYVFSFLGMAPKDDPKLIVYVAVQQPEIDDYTKGAIPVSEIFKPVMKNSLQYLNIQPSTQAIASAAKLPKFTGMAVDDVVKSVKEKGFDSVVLGKGTRVIGQLPKAGTKVLEGEKVIIQTDGDLTIPDMTGWSLRDVLKVANFAGVKLNSKGSGYVSKQNIKAGASLRSGDYLIVDLMTPEEKWKADNKVKDENSKNGKGLEKPEDMVKD